MQLGGSDRVLTQRGQCIVVAGEEREHVRCVVERDREGALQVGVQRLDLRREPRLRLALGPQQLVAEFGKPCRLALVPNDQRVSQLGFPALELAPDMAIGNAECFRGARDGAVFAHGMQQVHQRIADGIGRAASLGKRVRKLDFAHAAEYVSSGTHRYANAFIARQSRWRAAAAFRRIEPG